MGSEDWYRNITWDAGTEAAFNEKLARSRSQKAQYLRIQGSYLKDRHPDAAIDLFRRCIDEGDDFHIAHAYLDMAHAYYVKGDVSAALSSLKAAIEQQDRVPAFRTSAPYDFAFLAALHGRAEHYDLSLELLEREGAGFFASMVFEAEAAKALIFAFRRQPRRAQEAAQRALSAEAVEAGWIPGHPEVGVVPRSANSLHELLQTIASGRTEG